MTQRCRGSRENLRFPACLFCIVSSNQGETFWTQDIESPVDGRISTFGVFKAVKDSGVRQ